MFDSLLGLLIVVVSLLGFISLVWLRDQLTNGEGPEWLTTDQNNAQRQKEERKKNKVEIRKEHAKNAGSHSRMRQSVLERSQLKHDIKHVEAQLTVSYICMYSNVIYMYMYGT